jgi:hypothetical protein
MRPRSIRHAMAVLALSAAPLAACTPASMTPATGPVPASASADTVADRLFFGRTIPGGGMVSDSSWAEFLANVVSKAFPQGLTVWRAEGQWLDSHGTLEREQTMVVEVVHPAAQSVDATLQQIADEYKRRFRQDAVMRVTVPVRMRFYE